jgi:nitrogen fixation protein NifU and related proteins
MNGFSPRIVDHFTNPRNLGELDRPDVTAVVANPCCGDRIHLYARVTDERVTECRFLAYGCAACIAVGSILTEAVAGKPLHEISALDEGRLEALAGGLSPSQRHCATLAKDVVHTLVSRYRDTHPEGAVP